MLLQTFSDSTTASVTITGSGFFSNLLPVLAGNIIGGRVLVGLVYHIIYRRQPESG